jgi:hypothetical protein
MAIFALLDTLQEEGSAYRIMPRNPDEFIRFLSDHYRIIAGMCAERQRFGNDDEIAAFVRRFSDSDANPARLIGRMKDIGILTCGTGDWSVPSYLVRFFRELQNLYALATPEIVRASVRAMDKLVRDLENRAEVIERGPEFAEEDDTIFLLDQIRDALHTIICNVEENCDRITMEVNEFRRMEEASRIRNRLRRLIGLHDDYLDPVIHIIDISGEFHAVTDRVFVACSRLLGLTGMDCGRIGPLAAAVRSDVQWMRREVIRRAHEAKHELAPLCEAAIRESRIAKGVHRALEAIRSGRWDRLGLEARLPIQEESVRRLFSDQSVRNYMRMVRRAEKEGPARVTHAAPRHEEAPWPIDRIVADLEKAGEVKDIVRWMQAAYETMPADEAFAILGRLIAQRPDATIPREPRREYVFPGLSVEAAPWTWRSKHGD